MSTEDAQPAGPAGHTSHRRRPRLEAADIGFLCIPVVFGMWSLGIMHYLLGLTNIAELLYILFAVVALVPVALGFLVILPIRMLWARPRVSRGRVWFRLLAVVAGLIFLVAGFVAPLHASPYVMLARGFKVRMQIHADIDAIRTWLKTVDPNHVNGTNAGWKLDYESHRVPAIAELHPRGTQVSLDDEGRPMVQLFWGSGMLGHWGLVVGDEHMEIPKTELPRRMVSAQGADSSESPMYGECRLPLAPGAYVWSELE